MESREEGAEGIIKPDSDKGEEMEEKVQRVNSVDIVESETHDEDVSPDLKCPSDLSEINNMDIKRENEEGIGEQIKSDQLAVEHCDPHDVGGEELWTEGQVVDIVENKEVKENDKELTREDGAICGFETDALEQLAEGSSGSGEHQNRI